MIRHAFASSILYAAILSIPALTTPQQTLADEPVRIVDCRDGTTAPFGPGVCKEHGGVKKAQQTFGCMDGTRDTYKQDMSQICASHGGVKKP